jgi:hypothetical protein
MQRPMVSEDEPAEIDSKAINEEYKTWRVYLLKSLLSQS